MLMRIDDPEVGDCSSKRVAETELCLMFLIVSSWSLHNKEESLLVMLHLKVVPVYRTQLYQV
jgi:hypothetical protein